MEEFKLNKVTIQEIASVLNLSRNTVAKALNDNEAVAFDTRMLVIQKAIHMGYQKISPEIIEKYEEHKKEKNRTIKTVLVLSKRESSAFWNKIIIGISDELNENNCRMQFNFIGEDEEKSGVLPLDINDDVIGIILMNVFDKEYIKMIKKMNIPLVFLDGSPDLVEYNEYGDVLLFEGNRSVYALTQSLIDNNRKQIGFIGDVTYCRTIRDRYDGYIAALYENGIKPDETIIYTEHVAEKYYSMEEVNAVLEKLPETTEALVCGNDDIAKHVIICLRKKGINVPEDIAITGFDNSSSNIYLDLSLSTVDIQKSYMGRRLAKQVMWRSANLDMPQELVYVSTQVIHGDSTKRVR